ncbi:MAG TPA: GNAT family N-acetyltransferase [Bacilli bacterium]|nr:GNAT family N-acetyltransferase [Bacilli bacterium]
MEFKRIEKKYSEEMMKLWNHEFKNDYPLTIELINRNIFDCTNFDMESSICVFHDQRLAGFLIGKVWNEHYAIKTYESIGWLSLIYVHPEYRNRGIGTRMYNQFVTKMKEYGKNTIMVGKDPNNFFPGIPKEMKQHYQWFERRGFELHRDTYDLMRKINDGSEMIKLPDNPYQIQYMNESTFKQTIHFMEKNFPGRWTFELIDYIHKGGSGREYLLLIHQNTVIGFCRINDFDTKIINYNMTWKSLFSKPGGIGPLGIDEAYRKHKLGYYVVAYATNELIKRKVSDIVIDWTSLISFYEKFGFSIWKTYRYAQFSLTDSKNV